ncbi:hypothetical protein CDAR_587631 [Caerostris darwini]|uniref:Uncharacterized protein n=1 Tax=Caerostris darwini TaxID=1538125 RepID=A0AAV4SKT7_9ARAC|nr:hypothetical protein CDAR_587631 [Caerostris darwini]
MPQKLDNQNRGLVQCRITRPLERLGKTGNGAEFRIPESNEGKSGINILKPYCGSTNELYAALANTRRVRNQQNILRHRELGIITGRRLRFRSNVRYRHACRCQMPQKLDNQNRGLAQCRITRPLKRLGKSGNGAEFRIPESNERKSGINILKPYCGSSSDLSDA